MPSKTSCDENGVKNKQRSKRDASRRSFDLYGKASAKHVRQQEAVQNEARARKTNAPKEKDQRGKHR